jgi:hypothetical protein
MSYMDKKDHDLKIKIEHMDGIGSYRTPLHEWNWLDMGDMNDMDENNIDNFNGCVDQIQPYWDDGQTNLWI